MNKGPHFTPLPIHFKKPGRSYSQIGRKGNVALYSVYSDYDTDRHSSWPYVLLGFELIVIKTKNAVELYPSDWQFGQIAWSIPKSFFRPRRTRFGSRESRQPELRMFSAPTVPNRSTSSEVCADLAAVSPQTN